MNNKKYLVINRYAINDPKQDYVEVFLFETDDYDKAVLAINYLYQNTISKGGYAIWDTDLDQEIYYFDYEDFRNFSTSKLNTEEKELLNNIIINKPYLKTLFNEQQYKQVFGEKSLARNPNRIPKILALLQEIWEKHPDLRLGQLLIAATPTNNDLFYIEDGLLLEFLSEFDKKSEK